MYASGAHEYADQNRDCVIYSDSYRLTHLDLYFNAQRHFYQHTDLDLYFLSNTHDDHGFYRYHHQHGNDNLYGFDDAFRYKDCYGAIHPVAYSDIEGQFDAHEYIVRNSHSGDHVNA